jgi:hypothetical protein
MSSSARDDFPQRVIRILERRCGAACSNPGCRQPTSGPGQEPNTTINMGVAAHITAAAPKGPRHDKSLTPDQRSSALNGIWLCTYCSKLIDSDVARYASETLRQWKKQAEDGAFAAVSQRTGRRFGLIPSALELDEADHEWLRSLGLSPEESVDAVTARLRTAVSEDLGASRAAKHWPAHVIGRDLNLVSPGESPPLTLEGLAAAIGTAERVTLIADPGTGKSTFLIGLSESILAEENLIPALIPLSEWSDRKEGLFTFLGHRNAYRAFRPQHWMQVAFHGRLILLLDGWNEMDPDSQLRLSRELQALRRDFPLLGILLTTRRQHLPTEGPVVEIQPLTRAQQRELAHALRGAAGETLLEQAWREPRIRELVEIPLYLTALLQSTPEGRLPQTREELLRTFVDYLEREEDRRLLLDQALQGQHRNFLITLASEANHRANTAIPEEEARRVVAEHERQLIEIGQLTQGPEPKVVIETLVNTHALVRPAEGGGSTVGFQHQQIQEWYGSFQVEQLMRGSAEADPTARAKLRREALDRVAWEESVLFACERLSRASEQGAHAVAEAIRQALSIDPMLAAEMLQRSAEPVWSQISAHVFAFVDRWHRPGTPDRAARFMIMTGRPEFAPRLWPLIEHTNDQVALRTLQLAPRFPVSVLGADAKDRLAALAMPARARILTEIVYDGGYEGMELAATLARTDPDPQAAAEVIESLDFRGAERLVHEVLRGSSEAVWIRIARKGHIEHLADEALNARLQGYRETYVAGLDDPIQALFRLAEATPKTGEIGERLEVLVRSPNLHAREDRARMALDRAFEAYPIETARALLHRLEHGLDLPYRADVMMEAAPVVEAGPIVARALEVRPRAGPLGPEFAVLGPNVVGGMIDQLLALDEAYVQGNYQWTQAQGNESLHLREAIAATRLSSFIPALLERAQSEDPRKIALLADLVARRGPLDEGERLDAPLPVRETLVQLVLRWMPILLHSAEATRHDMSEVARAVARLGDARLVPGLREMLIRDLGNWTRARDALARSDRRGPQPRDSIMGYVIQYQRALVSIASPEALAVLYELLPDLQFGRYAAGALVEISQGGAKSRAGTLVLPGRDFAGVKDRRMQRAAAPPGQEPTSEAAERIFAVVQELLASSADEQVQQHALQLAVRGLLLPHRSDRALIERLLTLPTAPRWEAQLLASLALAGEVVPSARLIEGVRALLQSAEAQRGELIRDSQALSERLGLFAFSDRPGALLEMWETLPSELRAPWRWQSVVHAIGFSPEVDAALEVLAGLAQREPRFLGQYEWLQALGSLNGPSAARALLNAVRNVGSETTPRGSDRIESLPLARQLATYAGQFPDVRAQMITDYQRLPGSFSKSMLEDALAQAATPDALLALVHGYSAQGRAFDHRLGQAAEHLAVGRRPSGQLAGAYELFGVPLARLRHDLFHLSLTEGAESALALRCLLVIEQVRDRHGRLDAELRHPDVDSGRPWPREAE